MSRRSLFSLKQESRLKADEEVQPVFIHSITAPVVKEFSHVSVESQVLLVSSPSDGSKKKKKRGKRAARVKNKYGEDTDTQKSVIFTGSTCAFPVCAFTETQHGRGVSVCVSV